MLKPCLQNLKMRMSSSAVSCCTSLTCPLSWSQHRQETSMGLSAATVGLVLHPICCTGTSILPRCRCHRFMTSSAAMHAAACSTCIAHERFSAKGAMPGRQASSGVPVSLLPANFGTTHHHHQHIIYVFAQSKGCICTCRDRQNGALSVSSGKAATCYCTS